MGGLLQRHSPLYRDPGQAPELHLSEQRDPLQPPAWVIRPEIEALAAEHDLSRAQGAF